MVQHGLLVANVNQTFAFEWEWNFNLSQGAILNMSVLLKGGQTGINIILGPIDSKLNLVQPYLYTATLKPSSPIGKWTGTIPADGGYRLELGNLAGENDIATVQVYVHST